MKGEHMRLGKLLENTGAELFCDPMTEISGVYNDSRRVRPGGLFVAVSGFKEDGMKYIPAALAAGAVAVVCERRCDAPSAVVPDARRALSRIAANFYGDPTSELTVVGVTGTNGKTTVTNLVKHILERSTGGYVGLIGTNEIYDGGAPREAQRTTPESLELQEIFANMREHGVKHAVMEVSSHALALGRVDDVAFDVGAFTNLTQDHLDFHGDMENYLEAKRRLFSLCKKGVVNLDDEAAPRMAEGATCDIMTYGRAEGAALRAEEIRLGAGEVEFDAVWNGARQHMRLGIPGMFSVYNALAATGCALSLGLGLGEIADAIAECGGVKGRAEVVTTPTDYTVVIDYAHTPDALENILATLRGGCRGRLICVFGCGGDRDAAKRPIMGGIVERCADVCVVTSDNPRTEDPEAIIADIVAGMSQPQKRIVEVSRPAAIHLALDMARTGDVVLLAGKGHETYQEINGVKHHMDEREIVADYFIGRQTKD